MKLNDASVCKWVSWTSGNTRILGTRHWDKDLKRGQGGAEKNMGPIVKSLRFRTSHCDSAVMNLTSIHEDVG